MANEKNKKQSELAQLVKLIQQKTGLDYTQISSRCGYDTKGYISELLSREKNGAVVPKRTLAKLKKTFEFELSGGEKQYNYSDDGGMIEELLNRIGALETKITVMMRVQAEILSRDKNDYQNQYAILRGRIEEAAGPVLKTM